MTKDEALKLAMEGLERSVATCFDQYAHQQVMSQPDHFINQTITAIKEVLAQPPEEPVAWMDRDGNVSDNNDHGCFSIPLYTTPPQREWVGLTNEEMIESNDKEFFDEFIISAPDSDLIKFGRAIEAKLKEKNT